MVREERWTGLDAWERPKERWGRVGQPGNLPRDALLRPTAKRASLVSRSSIHHSHIALSPTLSPGPALSAPLTPRFTVARFPFPLTAHFLSPVHAPPLLLGQQTRGPLPPLTDYAGPPVSFALLLLRSSPMQQKLVEISGHQWTTHAMAVLHGQNPARINHWSAGFANSGGPRHGICHRRVSATASSREMYLSPTIGLGRTGLELKPIRSEPPDRKPTVQVRRYLFGLALLLKSP